MFRATTLAGASVLAMCAWAGPGLAETRSLSQDWLFQKGDSKGAENPAFDDRGWRKVVVPHDWSIMDKADGDPFEPNMTAGQDSGYLAGGVGWTAPVAGDGGSVLTPPALVQDMSHGAK